MWFLAIVIVVAVFAVWTAYQINKAGGYPPYQDNTQDMNIKLDQDDHWPFPKDKP